MPAAHRSATPRPADDATPRSYALTDAQVAAILAVAIVQTELRDAVPLAPGQWRDLQSAGRTLRQQQRDHAGRTD